MATLTNTRTMTNVRTIRPSSGQVKIIVNVINDDGGTAGARNFSIFINSIAVSNDTYVAVTPGTALCTYTPLEGYTATEWSGDATADGTVTVGIGESKTANITFNDNPF